MATPDVEIWQEDYADIELVSTDAWKQNLADYLEVQLTESLTLTTYSTDPEFTFDKAAFVTGLAGAGAPGTGVAALQTAFDAAVLASTMVTFPMSGFDPLSVATIFSVVTSTTVDPLSIVAGKAKIAELDGATPTSDPLLSKFPVILREAFLLLTYTVIGLDSTFPTPIPLTDALRGVE